MNPEALLREKIAKLEDQLAEARETIAYLEAQAGSDEGPDSDWLCMAAEHGITAKESQLLRALYQARGPVTLGQLEDAAWPDGAPSPDVLKAYACKLRKKLGGYHTIETVWGRAYALSEVGRAIVRQRLAAQRRRVA